MREETRFTLGLLVDTQRALGLAQTNWAIQKESWDAVCSSKAHLRSGTATPPNPCWIGSRLTTLPIRDCETWRPITHLPLHGGRDLEVGFKSENTSRKVCGTSGWAMIMAVPARTVAAGGADPHGQPLER